VRHLPKNYAVRRDRALLPNHILRPSRVRFALSVFLLCSRSPREWKKKKTSSCPGCAISFSHHMTCGSLIDSLKLVLLRTPILFMVPDCPAVLQVVPRHAVTNTLLCSVLKISRSYRSGEGMEKNQRPRCFSAVPTFTDRSHPIASASMNATHLETDDLWLLLHPLMVPLSSIPKGQDMSLP